MSIARTRAVFVTADIGGVCPAIDLRLERRRAAMRAAAGLVERTAARIAQSLHALHATLADALRSRPRY